MNTKFDAAAVEATITSHDGTVTVYNYAPHPGRLEDLLFFYRGEYQAGKIADYQVLPVI